MQEADRPTEATQQHRRQDGAEAGETGGDARRRNPFPWWKLGVVALVIVAAVLVVMARDGCTRSGSSTPSSARRAAETFTGETVLATINEDTITLADLNARLDAYPPHYRLRFKRQKHEFLEDLIDRTLLLRQAELKKIAENPEYRKSIEEQSGDPEREEHALVHILLWDQVVSKVTVSDEEIRAFYEAHKDDLPGNPSFEEAKETLMPKVRGDKRNEAVIAYVKSLKDAATITRNEAWIAAQKGLAVENPLDDALASGKPVLVDFGRTTCVPCRQIKPILEELGRELDGRVHVLVIDSDEFGYLSERCGIRVVPTQIFFDTSATELYRHRGFMSKDDILAKLKELGML